MKQRIEEVIKRLHLCGFLDGVHEVIGDTQVSLAHVLDDKEFLSESFKQTIQTFSQQLDTIQSLELSLQNKKILIDAAITTYILMSQMPESYAFHTNAHVFDSVISGILDIVENDQNIQLLIRQNQFTEDDLCFLLYAGVFHDTGYQQGPIGHEGRSAKIAIEYAKRRIPNSMNGLRGKSYEALQSLICATTVQGIPTDNGLLQRHDPDSFLHLILCDADMSHFYSKTFVEWAELLRDEMKVTFNHTYTDTERADMQYEILKRRTFLTDRAKKQYEDTPVTYFDETTQQPVKADSMKDYHMWQYTTNSLQSSEG